MSYRKKLIEVALPLAAINEASAREKANPFIKEHPRKIHLWWARRPLVTCRAVIFASLIDDPNDPTAPPEFVEACQELPRGRNATQSDTPRQRLFDFIETLVQWDSTTDDQVLVTARELIRLCTDGSPPPLLDPFAGGGSIPLEAQRLGLEAHASDLNPVAVMINKAMIEIPPRFADMPPVNPRDQEKIGSKTRWKGAAGLAADLRYYGEWIHDHAYEQIGHLYPNCHGESVNAWLWTRTVKCPNPACGARMPLARSFWLSKKEGRRVWVEPQIDKVTKTVQFTVKRGEGSPPAPPKVGRGAKFRCLVCGEVAPQDYIKAESMAGRMTSQLMAIVTEGDRRRGYYAPIPEHESVAVRAEPKWAPTEQMARDTTDLVSGRGYGFFTWADVFSQRQLTALTTFSDLLDGARAQIREDASAAGLSDDDTPLRAGGTGVLAYAEAMVTYLSLALSRLTDYSSTVCTWNATNENIRNTFARQAIPMTWDYPEANPFGNKLSFPNACEWLVPILDQLRPTGEGFARQQDARVLQEDGGYIVSTDPPYYDNIGYADLSDFFYVWLRRSLRSIYPGIFSTLLVPKTGELVALPYRFDGDSDAAHEHFESGLVQAFGRMREAMHHSFPMTVYYAFKQEEVVADQSVSSTGWETMLNGLIESGFAIVGTWPMRTERGVRTVSLGTNALASSIILVCRPRSADAPMASRRDFVSALRGELPKALREMQSGNIAPVDLAQASIGPGMAVYSRYRKVLEPNGDRLTVRTALQLINRELDAYLAEQEGYIDEDSRFAVAWFQQFGFEEGSFGQADVLARAKNTSVESLASAGVLKSGAGKVRLYRWDELDPGWDPRDDERLTVWEATHQLIERLNTHGEEGAARLLARLPSDVAAQARQLAYRLYNICERKKWAEHARAYNALVVSWSASQEQAADFREPQQGELL